ncbi:hypothetical protein EYR41_009692 [Orbilia oligospora]|uniref:Uncharacterized protein n=1 Tax=Orbilia oligospora TaxID=2813651 RepID=A0A7C8PGY4_ORBOL|nr:hypothetical protein TWF751_006145 [Orbilia oligospora]KAF3277168.1 hypothetical protein TWF132_001755 [Orbilia oligospora]TGJ65747.1 hypothetical protein EYR41_009692 [Orbilia oligospora]
MGKLLENAKFLEFSGCKTMSRSWITADTAGFDRDHMQNETFKASKKPKKTKTNYRTTKFANAAIEEKKIELSTFRFCEQL